jgi:hypothetical protein
MGALECPDVRSTVLPRQSRRLRAEGCTSAPSRRSQRVSIPCRKVARGSGNARFQPESRRHSADLSSGRISEFITLLGGATAICALYGLKLIGDRSTKVVVAVGTWLMIACPWPGRQRNRLASIKSGARRSAGYPSGLGQVRVSRPSAWRPARPLLPRADMVREIAAVGQGCPRGKVRPRTSAATSSPDSTPRRAN